MANPVDNTKYFEAFRASMTEAAEKLSGIHVANMEKMLKLQLAAVGKYSELGVEQLKELSATKDPKAVPELLRKQAGQFSDISTKVAEDVNEFVKLNVEYGQELQGVMRDVAAKMVPNAN